jgi:uncharacterized protein (TIGR03067 family)
MNRQVFLLVGIASLAFLVHPSVRHDAAQPEAKKAMVQAALDKLQGTWYHVSRHERGEEVAGEDKETLWVFRGEVFVSKQRGRVWQVGTIKIVDPTSNPKKMDLVLTDGVNEGKTVLAVYQVDDETFRYCGCMEARPTSLTTHKDDKHYTYCSTYKRLKR